MNIALSSEARFERTPDGAVWGSSAWGPRLWSRYLGVFDHVSVIGRLRAVDTPSSGYVQASGAGVSFVPVPDYRGVLGYARNASRLGTIARGAVERRDCAIILRVPSPIAFRVASSAIRVNRPFAVEVVGDPAQVFAPGVLGHPLRIGLRYATARAQARLCLAAGAALYVTDKALQARYPSPSRCFAVSDVELDDFLLPAARDRFSHAGGPLEIVTVASLEQPYKGVHVLVAAVAALRKSGIKVTLRVVGGGRLLKPLSEMADRLGVTDSVRFLGERNRDAIREELDRAGVFVLPSLTEGMPRALLEAMARGLPCLASRVGGIPEVLAPDDLVDPGCTHSLVFALRGMTESGRAQDAARRNLARAHSFSRAVLSSRREAFHREVLEQTRSWCERASPPVRALCA